MSPRTIIGYRRNGCPIWSIQGGSASAVEDPPKDSTKQSDAGGDGNDKPKADGDTPLGEGGKKALQSERDARKALEKQVSDMQQAQKDQMDALAKAFGLDEKQSSSDGDIVSTLQEQVAEMRHTAAVDRIAREHGITDKGDVELLQSAKDEAAMTRLAARLAAASAKQETDPKTGKPKPDPSAGSGSGKPERGTKEAGIAEAQRRFPKKQ